MFTIVPFSLFPSVVEYCPVFSVTKKLASWVILLGGKIKLFNFIKLHLTLILTSHCIPTIFLLALIFH